MAEHFKGVPYAPLINPFRLHTFEQDVNGAIAMRRADDLAKEALIASGRGDEGERLGWRMVINQDNPDIATSNYLFRSSVDHAIVLFLPTQRLLNIQRGLIKGRQLLSGIKARLGSLGFN